MRDLRKTRLGFVGRNSIYGTISINGSVMKQIWNELVSREESLEAKKDFQVQQGCAIWEKRDLVEKTRFTGQTRYMEQFWNRFEKI